MSSSLPESPALRERRERTISALCDHFASDRLTLEDFENRLDQAHRAQLPAQLDALVADIAPLPPPQTAPARSTTTAASVLQDHRVIIAVMGGAERRGNWRPGQKNIVLGLMGGAMLDFRDVPLPPGVTEVFVFACMGGVEIIVPPDLAVESHGFALMGGFGQYSDGPPPRGDGPVLRVNGFALMGGVEIHVRLPGETERDAKRRRKEERLLDREDERLRREDERRRRLR
jgi:hypothetical protein